MKNEEPMISKGDNILFYDVPPTTCINHFIISPKINISPENNDFKTKNYNILPSLFNPKFLSE